MKKGQRLWTRDELILAINLYCKTPFGKLHKGNPDIIHLAKLIDRTSSSVAFKLVNFASLDPSLKERGIKGADHASRLDREVWADFFGNWEESTFKSEVLRAEKEQTSLEELYKLPEDELPRIGLERDRIVKTRVNQAFFRHMVLAAYSNTCCITAINHPDFLIAGHISTWSDDPENRMNPRNGICINGLHDKAFEKGYMTILPDYTIKISPLLRKLVNEKQSLDFFLSYDKKSIRLPK